MRRSWTDSILLRIAVGVLCIEAAGLGLLGWHYQRSVSNYFDSILTQKALTVGRLVNAGTLDLNFLLDPEVMRELVGEELIDGMVVTAEGTVVLALDRSLVGSRVTHLLNLPAADWPKNTRQGLVMPINGGSHLGALTPIGTGEGRSPFLYLYVEISREATELSKQQMSRLVIFGIAVTLGLTSLLLIVLFHTQVARPLSQAARLIQHVEQGDFSSRITRLAGGELGDLQQGLNQMARRLEQMFADLQHKIGEVETARRELAAREAFQQQLLSHLPVGVVAEDDQGRLLFANAQAEHLLGFSAEECVGSDLTGRLSPEVREDWCRRRSDALCERRPVEIEEWRFPTEGPQDRVLTSSFVPLPGLSGEETHVLSIHQDITEQKQRQAEREQMQRKITESQRLESLGVLAGGIAHDFNNLLMAILGNTDLAKVGIAASSPVRTNLRAIEIAARRAAELCRQLLAYAGKGRFVLEAVDLRELVREMSEVMEVVVAKKAQLVLDFAHDTPVVEGDPSQLRQVILNLISNAAEAIPAPPGLITLRLYPMNCDRDYLETTFIGEELPPGLYLALEISDTGVGMTPDVQRRIFEPFFSTKFSGRGLGMAAVLGIVRSHRGAVKVYSEPGRGTSIKILLPAAERPVGAAAGREDTDKLLTMTGTILLVDDEESVRSVASRMLQHLGFRVLTASNGREALEVFRAHRSEIKSIVLDLTMPEMDGEETYRRIRSEDPRVRVILSSGYNSEEITRRFVGRGITAFIQKPYQLEELQRVLRKVMADA